MDADTQELLEQAVERITTAIENTSLDVQFNSEAVDVAIAHNPVDALVLIGQGLYAVANAIRSLGQQPAPQPKPKKKWENSND